MLYEHDDWFTEHDDSRADFEIEPIGDDQFVLTYVADGEVHRVLVALI